MFRLSELLSSLPSLTRPPQMPSLTSFWCLSLCIHTYANESGLSARAEQQNVDLGEAQPKKPSGATFHYRDPNASNLERRAYLQTTSLLASKLPSLWNVGRLCFKLSTCRL